MYRFILVCLPVVAALPAWASDFGITGLIDTPTARMSDDGTLTATAAIQSRTKSYALSYQVTPWLEGTFRYTGFNRAVYSYDRNYEAKVRLFKERDYLPQVAVGIRDLVGTGIWGSEYLVASKEVGDFDMTLGMGWGRLAGRGDFDNPMIQLSDRFSERNADTGLGGNVSYDNFFSGEKVGLFGGLRYQSSSLPISLMLEYNPDQYDFRLFEEAMDPKAP